MSMIQAQDNRETIKETDPHLANFAELENRLLDGAASWTFPIRKAGISRFMELGFPTVRDEDWRFTNVAPIAKLPFKPVFEPDRHGLTEADLKPFAFTGLRGSQLVFVNGHFAPELSSIEPQPDGVRVKSLAAALTEDSELLQRHLACYVTGEENAFAALNSAFFLDGAFIHVPKDRAVERPVHLMFISTLGEEGTAVHPRNLIVAEANSRLTVLESHVTCVEGAYLTNAVTEIMAGENAVVEHCKYQDESLEAFHMAGIHLHLGRRSVLRSHSISTGARLARNTIRTVLAEPGVECILNGLYLAKGEQLVDHHMVVDHASPHCDSHEYYNGILDGRSKGVFHGRILVRPGAQKTDAKQTNKNLLLTDDATINTKPQLEIYADDVKCTHGATIGQLNPESIFYLRARGIGEDMARRMLIHSFAGEIIDRIQCEPAREEMDELIWDRLEQNPIITAGPLTGVKTSHLTKD